MNRRTISLTVVSLAGALTLAAAAAFAATSWQVVKSPDPGSNGMYVSRNLREVTAASATRVWAAGFANGKAILASWTGSGWHLDKLPHHAAYSLMAIDTNGSGVWATGLNDSNNKVVVLQLKNGIWRYSTIPTAPALTSPVDLAVLSNSDVWIVGYSTGVSAVAIHWNGSSWSSDPPPVPAGASGVELNRVEKINGTSKVIGVGYYVKSSKFYPYAVEWTGSAWRVMSTPTSPQGNFFGVVVRSASSAWAVGWANPAATYPKTLIDHWNGIRWQRVSSPNRPYGNYLQSVDASSNGDVWAVGYSAGPKRFDTLAVHWNGSRWALAATPDPYRGFDELFGISHVPRTSTFWAVGSQGPARPAALGENTLIERCTSC